MLVIPYDRLRSNEAKWGQTKPNILFQRLLVFITAGKLYIHPQKIKELRNGMKKADIMIHAIRIGELNNRKELVDLTGDKRKAFMFAQWWRSRDVALKSKIKALIGKYIIWPREVISIGQGRLYYQEYAFTIIGGIISFILMIFSRDDSINHLLV